ncbi:peptidoglycan-recognition protein 1-like [Macrosteles quadrilineatus]|uniref:peptidoglycan-recognition protein 1-like n=1 Tax=Macrosteles quadrilineatus TaxID=74068 RepID=UPI0023E2583F|nr:peptidoglycan-recognition protein 1-like [Macrosteles quadrilineatus]
MNHAFRQRRGLATVPKDGYMGPPPGMPYEEPQVYLQADNYYHQPMAQKPGIDLESTIPREELYLQKECPIPFTTREQWGARPPLSVEKHKLPLVHLRFTDTDTEQCEGPEACHKLLWDLQKQHMDEGFPDIKYNFLIGLDGMIYEGRGWEVEADRPDEEYGWDLKRLKGVSVDIAYIGTYDRTCTVELPWKQMSAAFHFTHWASKWNLLDDMFTITQLRPPPSGDW